MFTFKSLRADYGQKATLLAKRYVNLTRDVSTYKKHLSFTKTCQDLNVIPRSVRLKRLAHTPEGNNVVAQAERRLVKARVHECHNIIRKKELDLYFLRRQLEYQMPDVFGSLDTFARNVAATTDQIKQTALKSKLAALKNSKEPRNDSRTTKSVVNLSSRQLSEHEASVLSKGHNFNTTTPPPLPQIIAAVEYGIQHIDSDSRDNVRLKAIGILSKLPARPRGNLTKPEKEALQELRKDSTITILPADKGNSTVILDRKSYEDKIKNLLNNPEYVKLTKDPTPRIQRELNKLLADIFKDHPESRTLYLRLICRNGSAPGFYGLPKIHKSGIPLRPIVDFRTSPLRMLSEHLHRTL
ncbi:uncharacterized protein LOC119406675 [Rhipicephalus sanguineus]|uniref:uncharacterized protein LOC119406675 n=1 Tax=Rhipicephalus sanguineus TaxID=34632 RepID=UPI0018947B12|nr:uncharacterized protein LOC119406675 [Rhipicephalus sanguineus]